MAHALQREAFSDGKVLLLGDAGDNSGRERELINNMLHRQVDGLIYTSVDRHPYIELIQESGTPCVMLDRVDPGLNVSVIQVDEQLAAWQVTKHLIDHGYRDIGIICGPREMLNTQDRIRGWQLALEESSLIINPSWIFSTNYTRAGGYEATKRMLQGKPPRALFATNEQQALGCLRALAEQGLRVPQDVALVCFNATQESAYNVPSLTAVRQPVDKMARAAIDMLKNWDGEVRRVEFEFFYEWESRVAARDMKYNLKPDKNKSMRVIIDCDPGNGIPGANIDDGLALALAIAAPQISLEMITTVAGNTPVEIGYAVAKDFVQQLGVPVSVYRGAARALREDPQPWREKLDHGVDQYGLRQLWADVPVPQAYQATKPLAPEAIGELICNNPGEITLVATGPLTNVAIALQLYPQLVHAVKNIVIMGGVFNVPGYLKDTNFGLDPEAAHAVLTSGAPVTLVPMDVTTKTQMLHTDLDRLAAAENVLGRYLEKTIRPWITYSMQTRNLPGCWIHDVLTIAWLLDPSLAATTEDFLDVSLEGLTRGMTCRYGRDTLRLDVGIPEPKGAMIKILQTIDNHQLLSLIEHYIHRYGA